MLFETWVGTRMGGVGQPGIMRVAQVSGSSPSLLPCGPSSTNCVLPGLETRETLLSLLSSLNQQIEVLDQAAKQAATEHEPARLADGAELTNLRCGPLARLRRKAEMI